MMAAVEKGGGTTAAADEEEERVLDFDMLCSMVAMQAHKGGWAKLNGNKQQEDEDEDEDEEKNLVSENGGGVFRMWEGDLVYDFFDHPQIALHSTCCPCYRFGKNMKRAGFGSTFTQGLVYLILVVIAISNLVAFIATGRRLHLYLAIAFTFSIGIYIGCHRTRIRKKFRIQDDESCFDDCVYHLICPCCTLSQESRTLEMNNVQDGVWHGRGDTICIGSFSEDSKLFPELSPPLVVSTKSPKSQKTSNDSFPLSASAVGNSSHLVPPPE